MLASDLTIETDLMIAMRDGVRLRTDVYLPPGDGPFPVLLSRTPYSLEIAPMDGAVGQVTGNGYAAVIQHVRGRYGSEGRFHPVHIDITDGYDAVEWAAAQPWSNGRVGMFGGSYLGMTQWMAALARPPHLKAIAPVASSPSFFGSNAWYWTPGVLAVGMALSWSGAQTTWEAVARGGSPAMPEFVAMEAAQRDMLTNPDAFMAAYKGLAELLDKLYAHRPLRDIETLRELAPWFLDWCDNDQPDDPYWHPIEAREHLADVDVPILHVGGWYDMFYKGAIEGYGAMLRRGSESVRGAQRLLIGPWNHVPGLPARPDGPPAPFLDMYELSTGSPIMDFYDRHVKGIETPRAGEKPISLFVMGENRWRHESEWPLPDTRWSSYFLHSDGSANTSGGNGALSTQPPRAQRPDTFVYDPASPVPGVVSLGLPGAPEAEPGNQALRDDVLVYTSPPLDQDLEVTGPVSLELWACSTAADTTFTAKLLDVLPDGTLIPLCQGVVRTGRVFPRGMVPGAAYRLEIDLWATSNLFKAGHRIRLQVSSSEYPTYELNPNTGRRITHDASGETVPATQTVLHDPRHPSRLILPVIPR
jgi:putative CocE/NonD family hydrolase